MRMSAAHRAAGNPSQYWTCSWSFVMIWSVNCSIGKTLTRGADTIQERGPSVVKVTMECVEDEENKRLLHVEIAPEQVDEYMNRAFQKMKHEVVVPGFRKGKVPRSIFEQRFGSEVLRQEALEDLIPEACEEAIEEMDLEPIDTPQISDLDDEDEDGKITFTAEVEVLPEVELGEYQDLDVDLELPEVTDEDVEETLRNMRENLATVEEADEDAEVTPGMVAVVSFEGYLEGELREDLTAEEEMVEIGSGEFLPDFEEGLVGARADEELEIDVQFPEDAQPPFDGAEVEFKVKVHEVRKKVLPELDDDFAREVSMDVETVEELRQMVRDRLTLNRQSEAVERFEQEVVSRAAENASVDVPQPLVDRAFEGQMERMQENLESYEVSMADFIRQRDYGSVREFEDEMRESAEKGVRQMLVLDAIADAEGIEPSEEEMRDEMRSRAEMMGVDPEIMSQYLQTSASDAVGDMQERVRREKTRRMLASWTDDEYDDVKQKVKQIEEKLQQKMQEAAAESTEEQSPVEQQQEEEQAPGPVKEDSSGEQ